MSTHPTFPVTVAVRRRVAPERVGELEGWAHSLCGSARGYAGFLGSEVSVRDHGGVMEVVTGISFRTSADLIAWERSDDRDRHLAMSAQLTEGPVTGVTVADLDSGLFGELPGRVAVAPARWKTAVAVWLALFPAALVVNVFLLPRVDSLPTVLATLMSTLLLVPFVVWCGMPVVHFFWGRIANRMHAVS